VARPARRRRGGEGGEGMKCAKCGQYLTVADKYMYDGRLNETRHLRCWPKSVQRQQMRLLAKAKREGFVI
jgi:hypothetical protein